MQGLCFECHSGGNGRNVTSLEQDVLPLRLLRAPRQWSSRRKSLVRKWKSGSPEMANSGSSTMTSGQFWLQESPVGSGVGAAGVSGSLSEDCMAPPLLPPVPLPDPVPLPKPLTLPVPVPMPSPVLPASVCLFTPRPAPCAQDRRPPISVRAGSPSQSACA